jgi:hypothetical protein
VEPARPVRTGGVDILCVRVTLPTNVGNAFQGAGTAATFRFDALPVAG